MKRARVWLAAALVAVAGLVVALLPLPLRVHGIALLQADPDGVHRVVIGDRGGFLKELLVKDGQQVRAGAVLAVLHNPELEIKLRVNEADQALRWQQKDALLAQLTEVGTVSDSAAGSLQETEFQLNALRREHTALCAQRERLTLRAPGDGTVLGLCAAEDRGKWLDQGAELCRIGNGRILRAVLLVPPSDHELVEPGRRAWVRIHGGGAGDWPGVVAGIAQVEAKSVPAPLSNRASGEVATQQDPVSRADRPYQQHYLCAVQLQAVDPALHPGAMGRVRIDAGSQTLWRRFCRYLATTFDYGL
jgi:multidrug efflux pump subunit AcrA (membrane-fusion protein)